MSSLSLKQVIKNSGVKQWEISQFIGVSEYTLCKKLRGAVTPEFEAKVLRAIASIQLERSLASESFEK